MEALRVQLLHRRSKEIIRGLGKSLKKVDKEVLVEGNPLEAFNTALAEYRAVKEKQHPGFVSPQRALLYTLLNLGYERIATQNIPQHIQYINIDSLGRHLNTNTWPHEIGLFFVRKFMGEYEKLAGIMRNKKVEKDKADEAFLNDVGLLDDDGKISGSYGYIRNFLAKHVPTRDVQASKLQSTAFTLLAYNKFPDADPNEIASAYNANNKSGMLTRLVSRPTNLFHNSSNDSAAEKQLSYQDVTNTKENGACFGKSELMRQIMNPKMGEEPVHQTCSNCPLFIANQGVSCGLAAIRAHDVHALEIVHTTNKHASLTHPNSITQQLLELKITSDYVPPTIFTPYTN